MGLELGLPNPIAGLSDTCVVAGVLAAGVNFGGGGAAFWAGAGVGGAGLLPAPKFHTLRTRDLAEDKNPKREVFVLATNEGGSTHVSLLTSIVVH